MTALQISLMLLLCAQAAQAEQSKGRGGEQAAEIFILYDPERSLDIQNVSSEELSSSFQKLTGQRGLGHNTGYVWIKITLAEAVKRGSSVWIELASPTVEEAQIYVQDTSGKYVVSEAIGSKYPITKREIVHRTPVFKLTTPENKPYTVYLRLQGSNTLIVGPTVWAPEEFVEHVAEEQLVIGGYGAVQLLTILGFVWLWRHKRNISYFILAVFVLSALVLLLSSEGVIHQYILPERAGVTNYLMLISWIISYITLTALVYRTLKKPALESVALKVHLISVVAAMVLTISYVVDSRVGVILKIYRLWTFVILTSLAVALVERGDNDDALKKPILITICVLFVGAMLKYARNMGWIPAGPLTNYAVFLSFSSFPVLLIQRVMTQIEIEQKNNNEEREQKIRNVQEVAHELETLVAQRTAALNEALQISAAALELKKKAIEDERQFFATVSHELRTPLSVIDAAAMNLQYDLPSEDEKARLRCGRIRRSVDQLSSLIKNCLDVDRQMLGLRGVRYEEIEARNIIYEAYDAARVTSTQHEIEIDIHDLPPKFICDPELTRLAFRTLAINAIKYTPTGTRVTLTGMQVDDDVILEVRDYGLGVSETEIPNLFRRYYRGENSIGVPGTGLGLPLAREMIEAQNGQLTVESSQGKGFIARIRLPIKPQNDSCHLSVSVKPTAVSC